MENADNRRKEITSFLHLHGYLEKEKLIDRAIRENLYKNAEGREDIYSSLMNFKKYHGIRCHAPKINAPKIVEVEKPISDIFIDTHIKVSTRSNKLVSAIKEEIANLQQQQRLLENLLSIYEKEIK